MKRILVTAAGGSPATGFARSLRSAPEPYHLIGVDANKYTLQRAEVDQRFLVPKVSHPRYFDVLREVIAETRPDFLHVQMSEEMLAISGSRESLGTRTFLPRHETVAWAARSVRDLQLLMTVLADVPAAPTPSLRDLRIGLWIDEPTFP